MWFLALYIFTILFCNFRPRKCIWKCCLLKWQPFHPWGDEFTGNDSVLTDFLTSWSLWNKHECHHYNDVIMGVMASQITSLTIVYSTVYLGADQRKDQSSASLAFVLGIHRWLVNSPHEGPVTRKMFPFDDVIMFDSNAFKNDFSKMLTILYRRQWVCSCNDGNILCWKTHFLYNCELTMTTDIFCTIISLQ